MLKPSDEYKHLAKVNNITDVAYFTLFEKYLQRNLKGENKLFDIESTDQESLIISKNGGYPIPGFMYTFMYKGSDLSYKGKEFTDLVPIVFCMSSGGPDSFSGINMNILPNDVRLNFLDSFYESFKDFLKREVDVLAENQKLAINKRFINLVKNGEGQKMIKIYNSKNGANFNFAYRKYSFKFIKNFRMIEYSEWKYLPFYTPKDAFRKLSYDSVHRLYNISNK